MVSTPEVGIVFGPVFCFGRKIPGINFMKNVWFLFIHLFERETEYTYAQVNVGRGRGRGRGTSRLLLSMEPN